MAAIRDRLANAPNPDGRFLWGRAASFCFGDILQTSSLGGRLSDLFGRVVLIATRDQLAAARALIELDGIARRLIVGTPDLAAEHLRLVVQQGEVDAIVSDDDTDGVEPDVLGVRCDVANVVPLELSPERCATEWVLLTSGTTGTPKLVSHHLTTLTGAFGDGRFAAGQQVVWGTFYDIRRYGGLQIFLRAVFGAGSLIVSGPGEPLGDFLGRLAARGVTHISGTASHWRRVLMSPRATEIAPEYIRLSGEIADQVILNALHSFYPNASIGHAFASTEAGVGFEVDDGQEGFPASFLDRRGNVELRVEDGSLRIRSDRTASRYLGDAGAVAIADADGFVDTGDMVERRGDRYIFLGRRTGIINVGGLKVYPEEVEAAINRHPAVRMSIVKPKRSPITGSLVAADVVLNENGNAADGRQQQIRREILEHCQSQLPVYKIPVAIRFVPALEMTAAGKMGRPRE
jgi:acyl-coenzyme A synthetase/AMP-(fatty) acid ligase